MKTDPKRCTARGNLVRDTGTGAPTKEKLADGQLADHYVLCPEDRAKGYVEPYRESYIHETCGAVTRMPVACAETYAAKPEYYGRTFCCGCGSYFPVGENGDFIWDDGSRQKVGTRRERGQ
jgi:hypothetical protein